MKIYSFFLLLLVGLSACGQNTTSNTEQSSEKTVYNLSMADFKKSYENQEGLQILDVRTARETAGGKIGEAPEIDFFDGEFAKKVAQLDFDKSQPVVIYCASGGRSAKAAEVFLAQGYTSVFNLLGGYNAYK